MIRQVMTMFCDGTLEDDSPCPNHITFDKNVTMIGQARRIARSQGWSRHWLSSYQADDGRSHRHDFCPDCSKRRLPE